MEIGPITPSEELRCRPGLAHALLPLLGTAVLLGVGYGLLHIKAEILLVTAAALTGCLARALGLSWREIQSGMLQSIMKGMPAMLIVIIVGALIGSWLPASSR
jgi:NhaC family Na+:H+ antiporter